MQQQDWRDTLSALSSLLDSDTTPDTTTDSGDAAETTPGQAGILHIALERKGRAGKTATIIYGFSDDDRTIAEIASQLKRAIGCGGSARGGEILLQGDRVEAARYFLAGKGFKIK